MSVKNNNNVREFLRTAGYHPETNSNTGEISYIRAADSRPFPRFHIYTKEINDGYEINLHLDQKMPSYEGVSAHAGEYEGEIVEKEIKRMQMLLNQPKSFLQIEDYP